jgi:hypothetical protein
MALYDIKDSTLRASVEGAISTRAAVLAAADATRFNDETKAFNNALADIVRLAATIYSPENDETDPRNALKRGSYIAIERSRLRGPQPPRDANWFADQLRQGYIGADNGKAAEANYRLVVTE